MAVFVGRCDSLRAIDLEKFDDSSREISNRTFRKHIGKEMYEEFERDLGYGRSWLLLSGDCHVSYAKGLWKGKPAVCCFWSAYHHIFLIDEVRRESAIP